MIVVDAANVVGSRPDGWWRDRAGAARGFVDQVRRAVEAGDVEAPVVIVLEGAARAGAAEGEEDDVTVVHAPGEGDAAIAAIAQQLAGCVVVTADRELASRVRAGGATVVGPRWLLDRLA